MKKTSETTWTYKGWDVEYFGNGYRMTRRENVNGETVTKTAASLKKAEVIIENVEQDVRLLGRVIPRRK